MSCSKRVFFFLFLFLLLLIIVIQSCCGLNSDGVFLLSFKYGVLKDPLMVLQNWNYSDDTPCLWLGVSCSDQFRVTALSLPNSQLLGSISPDLGLIQTLQSLDLSNNSFNGSLPFSLFNATHLRFLDLSGNMISGEVPEIVGQLINLQAFNLSDNVLAGKIPRNLTALENLTFVSFKSNYIFGTLPSGFRIVQVLDLSSNLINGSLPSDFGGDNLHFLNISYNRLSGEIPPEFSNSIPANATLDFSFNNLTGEIPHSDAFMNQETNSFAGNRNLCGEPTKNPCPIPSSPASLPPAIAAIPKTLDPSTPSETETEKQSQTGFKPSTIVAIVLGDVVGLGILCLLFFYVYHLKKRNKKSDNTLKNEANLAKDSWSSSSSSSESRGFSRWSCLRKIGDHEGEASDQTSIEGEEKNKNQEKEKEEEQSNRGTLVTVDGEKELELETLLKASAYILGATGSSITYKAVLEDGTTFAVRRIGEGGVEKYKDFENQIRIVAKLVHPNLVHIRGFYWGVDEKLIIYDFVPNGSLANARYRKVGSSPCHLPWEARLRIARGVARGLSYLHEKKHIHGNLRPSNILLGHDMEPKIGDFGLEKILLGDTSYKAGGSNRNFGSKRSTASRDSFQDYVNGPSPSPSSIGGVSPYLAPESLRSLKPNPKWDVYSFGMILLELLTGKVMVIDEMGQALGLVVEDKNRALKMADMAIRADVEGKEEALLCWFKLGYSCASPTPQKRPTMKEALQVLEKFPSTSSYHYGL